MPFRIKKIFIKGKDREIVVYHRFDLANLVLILGEKNILIDPGYVIPQDLPNIDEIWLTHYHPDHTFSLYKFPDIPVFAHPITRMILKNKKPIEEIRRIESESVKRFIAGMPKTRGKFWNRFFSNLLNGMAIYYTINWKGGIDINPFRDGEMRHNIRIVYLPGHTGDSIGYFLPDEKILISGDFTTRWDANTVNLFLPEGNMDDALRSIQRMIKLSPEMLIPGHRNIIYNPLPNLERIYNKTLILKEEALRSFSPDFPFSTFFRWQKILPKPISLISRFSAMVIMYKMCQRHSRESNVIPAKVYPCKS